MEGRHPVALRSRFAAGCDQGSEGGWPAASRPCAQAAAKTTMRQAAPAALAGAAWCTHGDDQLLGTMFWFNRKTFVGSYSSFSATSRSYLSP
jgi:hypothetical protein